MTVEEVLTDASGSAQSLPKSNSSFPASRSLSESQALSNSSKSVNDSQKGVNASNTMSDFERIAMELTTDELVQKEITLGKRIGFYRICGELGTGNFSQVKLASHLLTRDKVAIKILDKTKLDAKTQRLLSREVSVMERLSHPCVIRLYEVLESVAKINIVMEYAPGGELFSKITTSGRLQEKMARPLFAQVVSALDHMHERHVIHRDIKSENVFFSGPMHIKVGDFGFSTIARFDDKLNTFCGSPPYAAPELFQDDYYCGPLVDIWAMGILLYFMVCGVMPFRADTVGKLKKCILAGDFTIPTYVPVPCQTLIRNILRINPSDRYTIEQIKSSSWLMHEELPVSLENYEMTPRHVTDTSTLSSHELEARRHLQTLGITEQHFSKIGEHSSRSAVTGTYRIMLHKIHKRESGEITLSPPTSPTKSSSSTVRGGGAGNRQQQADKKQQSKACILL